MPSKEEYDEAFNNLKAHDNQVDYIITHEAPGNILLSMGCTQNEVSNNLWKIFDSTEFDKWYCGHHHVDEQYERVQILYNEIVLLQAQ